MDGQIDINDIQNKLNAALNIDANRCCGGQFLLYLIVMVHLA